MTGSKRSYVLSFNPVVEADRYRICAGRMPNEGDVALMKRARAIILPQGCSSELYWTAVRYCPNVFPNYRCRFLYPGKTGQIRMFRDFSIPHPKTMLFSNVDSFCHHLLDSLPYPVVLKSSHGGEGENVFFVPDQKTLKNVLDSIRNMELAGFYGFLVQDYVPNDGKDLRVVIMGKRLYAYWRVGPEGEFLHNVSKGATCDLTSDEKRILAGMSLADNFRKLTGINLAGIDIIFHKDDLEGKKPLLLEVNYFFGRKGLGGNEVYYQLLNETVREWLLSLPSK